MNAKNICYPGIIVLLMATGGCSYCLPRKMYLATECALICRNSRLPVHYSQEKKQCCCQNSTDINTRYFVVREKTGKDKGKACLDLAAKNF